MAARTPKSPQPGHQSGSTLPFRSATVSWVARCTVVAICTSCSHHDLVHGNGEFCPPGELFLDRLNNVVRHERFAVVLTNVAVRHKTCLATRVARELTAVVVLHDDRA